MLIDQDRQLLIFFRGMREGVAYIPTEDFWESYQRARVESGWAPTNVVRNEIAFVKSGNAIKCGRTTLVKDLSSPPENLTLALTLAAHGPLAFALAHGPFAFALALGPFALAGGAFEPIDSVAPSIDESFETNNGNQMSFDNLNAYCGEQLKGDLRGFYRETPTQQVAGMMKQDGTVDLALHGLTAEQTAQIFHIIGRRV